MFSWPYLPVSSISLLSRFTNKSISPLKIVNMRNTLRLLNSCTYLPPVLSRQPYKSRRYCSQRAANCSTSSLPTQTRSNSLSMLLQIFDFIFLHATVYFTTSKRSFATLNLHKTFEWNFLYNALPPAYRAKTWLYRYIGMPLLTARTYTRNNQHIQKCC